MALISLRQLLDHAAEYDYAIPAFNLTNLEQMRAIMMAANAVNSPVIVQASAMARTYVGPRFLKYLIMAAVEEFPEIPVCMHQDEAHTMGVCEQAIQLGFSSVMIDGSLKEDMSTPSDYEYNRYLTKQVVDIAHVCGVSVEGTLGCLGSLETHTATKSDGSGATGHLTETTILTDPNQAEMFVKDTGVDALAIAIGTSHGVFKFSKPPTEETFAIDRVREIHSCVPNTHLVLPGASSVPQDWIAIINEYGGDIGETYGIPIDMLQQLIPLGVRKFNIDVDLRLAATGAIRQHLATNKRHFDLRQYNAKAMEAIQNICKNRFEAFGAAGKANQIKPILLENMVSQYK